jgi:hypothetical protein
MDQFLTLLGNNLIFSVPLAIVTVFALLEIILMMTGFSVLEPINGLFDGAEGIDAPGTELLAWANKGGVPSTVFYGILLMSFGACGLFIVSVFYGFAAPAWYMSAAIASVSFFAALAWTRWVSLLAAKYLPQVQTSAFSKKELLGCECEVKDYKITKEQGGDIKVADKNGKERFVFARSAGDDELVKGDIALIVRIDKNNFYIRKKS